MSAAKIRAINFSAACIYLFHLSPRSFSLEVRLDIRPWRAIHVYRSRARAKKGECVRSAELFVYHLSLRNAYSREPRERARLCGRVSSREKTEKRFRARLRKAARSPSRNPEISHSILEMSRSYRVVYPTCGDENKDRRDFGGFAWGFEGKVGRGNYGRLCGTIC